jgi:hypothetical protein
MAAGCGTGNERSRVLRSGATKGGGVACFVYIRIVRIMCAGMAGPLRGVARTYIPMYSTVIWMYRVAREGLVVRGLLAQ